MPCAAGQNKKYKPAALFQPQCDCEGPAGSANAEAASIWLVRSKEERRFSFLGLFSGFSPAFLMLFVYFSYTFPLL